MFMPFAILMTTSDGQKRKIFFILRFHRFESVQGYYDCCVDSIITTVIDSLWENENRKFTYVEMAFFYMWWQEQDAETQYKVKKLVEQGQLDFSM